MYYVYILQSLALTRFYIGVTKDLEQRIKRHNSGSSRSTKPYRPWKIIYYEKHPSKESGMKREYFLKSTKGYLEKKSIISQHLQQGEVA